MGLGASAQAGGTAEGLALPIHVPESARVLPRAERAPTEGFREFQEAAGAASSGAQLWTVAAASQVTLSQAAGRPP
eukprot:11176724-Lingulodinium_polyedra.AAC.1